MNRKPQKIQSLSAAIGFLLALISCSTSTATETAKVPTTPDKSGKAAPSNVNYTDYLRYMEKRLKSCWAPPKSNSSSFVVAEFQLSKDGTIYNTVIANSSGNKEVEKRALEALALASPLFALPNGSPQSLHLRFTFQYNVLKGEPTLKKDIAPADEATRATSSLALFKEAKLLNEKKDYDGAITKLHEALKNCPDSIAPGINGFLADTLIRSGIEQLSSSPEKAAALFRTAISLGFNEAVAKDQLENAMAQTRQDSSSYKERIKLGEKFEKNKQFEFAAVEYAVAIKLMKGESKKDALSGSKEEAVAYYKDLQETLVKYQGLKAKESMFKSMDTWRYFISAHPKSVDGYLGLSRAHEILGELDRAIVTLEQGMDATESDPKLAPQLERLKQLKKNQPVLKVPDPISK